MSTKIAIFSSGNGSNAENIVTYLENVNNIEIPLIIVNKKDAFIHERAKNLGIPSYTFSSDEFREANKIISLLQSYEIDGIVLSGFLLRVSEPFLKLFPNKIINIHPALLPKFGGKGMYGMHVHEAVKLANESETGITIHYVNENYDEGNVIFQASCPVLPTDTADDIAHNVQLLEHKHFPQIVEQVFSE